MRNNNTELTTFEKIVSYFIGALLSVCLIAQWDATSDNDILVTASKMDVDTIERKSHPITYEYNGEDFTEYRHHSTMYDTTYEYWYDGNVYYYKVRTYNKPEDTIELYINPNNPNDAIDKDSKVSIEELVVD